MARSDHRQRALAMQLAEALAIYADCIEQWCANPSNVSAYSRAGTNMQLVGSLGDHVFRGGRAELIELPMVHAELRKRVLRRHIAQGAGADLTRDNRIDQLRGRAADLTRQVGTACLALAQSAQGVAKRRAVLPLLPWPGRREANAPTPAS